MMQSGGRKYIIGAVKRMLSMRSSAPPMPGRNLPAVLCAAASFQQRFREVADDGRKAEDQPEDDLRGSECRKLQVLPASMRPARSRRRR